MSGRFEYVLYFVTLLEIVRFCPGFLRLACFLKDPCFLVLKSHISSFSFTLIKLNIVVGGLERLELKIYSDGKSNAFRWLYFSKTNLATVG